MTDRQRRKKLASLSFTKKIKLLEKLRDRSLALAEARKKLVAIKLEKRNVGEHDHAAVQAALILWFWTAAAGVEDWGASRTENADFTHQILTKPPLACIEILSPEDTLRRMQERVADYRHFGVEHIWILDPATQRGYNCQASGLLDATEFRITNTPIHLVLPELFARIRRS